MTIIANGKIVIKNVASIQNTGILNLKIIKCQIGYNKKLDLTSYLNWKQFDRNCIKI